MSRGTCAGPNRPGDPEECVVIVLETLQRSFGAMLRNPLAFVLTLIAGAGLGFAYSYLPLHSAKLWQVEYLESRVGSLRSQVTKLETDLAASEARAESLPDPGEIDALRTRLAEAESRTSKLEKERATHLANLEQMTRSRDAWRRKQRDAEKRIAKLEAPPPPPPAAAPEPEVMPASPDPGASAWPEEVPSGRPFGDSAPPGAGSRPDLQ